MFYLFIYLFNLLYNIALVLPYIEINPPGHGLFQILLPELSMSCSERLRQSSSSDVIHSFLHSLILIHMVAGEGSGIHLYSLNKNEGDPGTSIDQQHRRVLIWVSGHFNSDPRVHFDSLSPTPKSVCIVLPELLQVY